MKNLLILIGQLVGMVLILAFFFSLANYIFGWHLGLKGQEVPGDPRSAMLFLVIGVVLLGIAYLWDRRAKSQNQN